MAQSRKRKKTSKFKLQNVRRKQDNNNLGHLAVLLGLGVVRNELNEGRFFEVVEPHLWSDRPKSIQVHSVPVLAAISSR